MPEHFTPSVDIGMTSARNVSDPLLSALKTDKGMAFAQLGVPLFCAPSMDTAAVFARELGVSLFGVPSMDTVAVFARELGVSLFRAPNMDTAAVFAPELGVSLFGAPSMDTVAVFAQELGVSLFHAPNMDMAAVFAPELGVSLFSAPNMDVAAFVTRELGVPLSILETDAVFAQGSNPTRAFVVSPLLFNLLTLLPHPFGDASTSTIARADQSLYFDNIEGMVDNNVGIWLVTSFLNFIFSVFHLFTSVLCSLHDLLWNILTYLTPHNRWWPPYLYQLNLCIISCSFSPVKSVSERCRQLKVIILQNMFKRHDFVVYQLLLCKVRRFTVLFTITSHISFAILPTCIPQNALPLPVNELHTAYTQIGGGRVPLFQLEEILSHVDISGKCFKPGNSLKFIGHKHKNVAEALYKGLNDHVYGNVPLTQILFKATVKDAKTVAKLHGVHVPSKSRAGEISSLFEEHSCALCKTHVSVFALHAVKSNSEKCKQWYDNLDTSRKKHKQNNAKQAAKNKREALRLKPHEFPPEPPSEDLREAIARGWCENTSPEEFVEAGCAVCGQLTPVVQLSELSKVGCDLDILVREGMGLTRLERLSKDEPVTSP
jgi:hypothetical protein